MTKTELKAFRRLLEDRQTELAGRDYSRGALAIQRSPDELDRIQETQERELALGDLDRTSVSMREVRDALQRIDTEQFGICVNCEETINPRRLAARSRGLQPASCVRKPPIASKRILGARAS